MFDALMFKVVEATPDRAVARFRWWVPRSYRRAVIDGIVQGAPERGMRALTFADDRLVGAMRADD